MIEKINDLNNEKIKVFLKEKLKLKKEEIDFHINKSNNILIYTNDNSEIIGICTFRIWRNENVDIYTYVLSKERNKGIGTLLFKEITKDITDLKMISSRVDSNYIKSSKFYIDLGFTEWYTECILKLNIEKKYNSSLKLVKYEDSYFNDYASALRESFYKLRSANDFKPYYCLELSEEKRNEFIKEKDKIYLLLEDNKVVASIKIDGNEIDDVFVISSYRKKGIGEELIKFGISKIQEKSKVVFIDVIKWNKIAFHLYTKLGFKIFDTKIYFKKLFNGG